MIPLIFGRNLLPYCMFLCCTDPLGLPFPLHSIMISGQLLQFWATFVFEKKNCTQNVFLPVFFHPQIFLTLHVWHFWMPHAILSTSQILANFHLPPPQKKKCGWSTTQLYNMCRKNADAQNTSVKEPRLSRQGNETPDQQPTTVSDNSSLFFLACCSLVLASILLVDPFAWRELVYLHPGRKTARWLFGQHFLHSLCNVTWTCTVGSVVSFCFLYFCINRAHQGDFQAIL